MLGVRLRLRPMDWRQKLKSQLRSKGITLREIGDALSVTEGAVSHWLSGRREPPIKAIRAMAKLAGVTMDELFGQDSKYLLIDEEEVRIVEMMRAIPAADKDTLLRMLAALAAPLENLDPDTR